MYAHILWSRSTWRLNPCSHIIGRYNFGDTQNVLIIIHTSSSCSNSCRSMLHMKHFDFMSSSVRYCEHDKKKFIFFVASNIHVHNNTLGLRIAHHASC